VDHPPRLFCTSTYDKLSYMQKNNLLIPLSIIIAGAMVAGALYFAKKDSLPAQPNQVTASRPEENMRPVDSTDHILGNPNADIILVEYSDFDCPFCQAFHPTMKKIIDEYGKKGQVAWVYRHFAFHENAPKEAEASECVAELGGNEKFWQFTDVLFSKKNFNEQPYKGLDPKELPNIAASIGINKTQFTQCLNSGKYEDKIKESYNDAVNSGAQGTPYTIIVTKNEKIPITRGAIPFEQLKSAIDTILSQK